MIKDNTLSSIIYGSPNDLSDTIKEGLESRVRSVSMELDRERSLNSSKSRSTKSSMMSEDKYSSLVNLINNQMGNNDVGVDKMVNELFEKNKRYYDVLKDYDMMPILIPQILRVLSFLVDECVSPDLQNDVTFKINIDNNIARNNNINEEIERIRKTYELDRLLISAWTNRFKMGSEYYLVSDYKKTFSLFEDRLKERSLLNETTGVYNKTDYEILNESFSHFTKTSNINNINDKILYESYIGEIEKAKSDDDILNRENLLNELNISMEISTIPEMVNKVHLESVADKYSTNSFYSNILNEDKTEDDKYRTILNYLKKKEYNDCSVYRLDPARVFKLTAGGKTIGYFYIKETKEEKNHVIELANTIRTKLRRNRTLSSDKNHNEEEERYEKKIASVLAKKIIDKFDPSIGINNVEDIDLLHNYIMHNELDQGNKTITFYYSHEIMDLSRNEGSLLTNAVFFTKLCSSLLLNNIVTKILRGRGRQIHTVNTGVSASIQRYIENALSALSMPQTRLGSITGSFKYLINPTYASSDIIIPSEDGTERFITTDVVDGQDIDMDMDMIKFLMNSIVLSFGLDSAVLDTTNGNIDFAKTLTMISKQIANKVLLEQKDFLPSWSKMILTILKIVGSDDLKELIDNDGIEVTFFSPRSLLINMSNDEINNAKQYAESVADAMPQFQLSGDDVNIKRSIFVYTIMKQEVNINWDKYENILTDLSMFNDMKMEEDIDALIKKYNEMTKDKPMNNEENIDDGLSDDYSDDDDLDM